MSSFTTASRASLSSPTPMGHPERSRTRRATPQVAGSHWRIMPQGNSCIFAIHGISQFMTKGQFIKRLSLLGASRTPRPTMVAVKHNLRQWVILSGVEPAGRHRRWRDLIGVLCRKVAEKIVGMMGFGKRIHQISFPSSLIPFP